MQDYDLLTHNCNNFTNECAIFLLGKGIPQDIIDLPNRALSTPMGAMIRPAIEQYQQSMVHARVGGVHRAHANTFQVTQYANIDQSITAAATPGNPHAHLNVRLLTTGTPIAYNQGTLQAAVERLRELMGATPLPLTVSGMSALPNAAAIVHLDAAVLATLVSDLWALVAVLPEPHRYPVFDLLRVACLHPQCDLTSARERLGALLEATSKPTLIAALRVVQNALLRPLSPVVAVPTDVATGRMVARGLGSPEAAVRKAAATCAYNFALARSSSEALIIVASAAALAVKSGRDAVDSIETLGYVLCMGVACYGNVSTCAALRVHAVPLAPLLASPNAQVALAAQQLAAVLNA